MVSIKRLISLLLCLMMLTGMAVTVQATEDFELGQTWDDSILAGGILDMYVWVGENPEDYTFQWQVDLGIGEGHWYDLEDNADPYGYKGTDTFHMEFISPMANGHILGSGWEEIPFCCKVTNKKTGYVKYTPNIYMHIYSSDNLEEYMKNKGIELYTPSAGTSTPSKTTDGITYYTDAEGGQKLTMYCGYANPVNVPLMGRSELRADMEIWVTEDGKTTKLSSPNYFPHKLGEDALSVDFKLHYKIGVTDLGYYQTKTLKVSVAEPHVVCCGTTKQEMGLLKDPYSQSQKLLQIPQGAQVNVYQNSGSWYMVGYGGYVGYVAGSALLLTEGAPVIEYVDLAVNEPVAGNPWPTTVNIKQGSCQVTSVEWIDKTEDRFLDSGEKFIKGHDYQLVVWVSAKDGYTFLMDGNENIKASAILNGNLPCVTSQAYEQIRGKVMDVRYDFLNVKEAAPSHSCVPVKVEAVSPSCTKEGRKAYFQCSCGKNYADTAGTQTVDPASLSVPAVGHKVSTWKDNGTEHYQQCTVCREIIPGTKAPHTGGTANCLQKASCSTCGKQYGKLEDHKWSPRRHVFNEKGHAYQCADCKIYDTVLPHTPGPAATETSPQTCTECGYVITPAKSHTHTLEKVAAKEATCLTPGNLEYYTCQGCSQWWQDAAGTKSVEDRSAVELLPLGHFTGDAWQQDEQTHWQNCVVCMTVVEAGVGAHSDTDADGACDICGHGAKKEVVLPEDFTEPMQPAEPIQPTAPSQEQEAPEAPGVGELQLTELIVPMVVALFAFAAAITVTVIILTKKK